MAKGSTKASTKISDCSPMVDKSWQARSDLETLSRADEIRRDRERMTAAKAEARKQIKATERVLKPGKK